MGTQFIQIPREFETLTKNTKFVDVLVYSIIDFYKDNGKSRIGMRTIADKLNMSLSKVEESIKRLKDIGFIDYIQYKSTKYDGVFNEYTFPLSKFNRGFIMLMPELLSLDLKPKERGFLIYLQLIAVPGMNDIFETKIEDLANRMGVTRQTMSKYMKMFLAKDLIRKPNRLYICKFLFKKDKKTTNNLILL